MNWTHTSTAAVAAKKSGAPNTAKIRKTVINVIVHFPGNTGIYLGSPDFLGNPYKFPWRERFLCKYIFPENLYI